MTNESVPHESNHNNTPDNKPTWLTLALKGRLAEIENEAPYNPVPTVSEPDLTGCEPYCPDLYQPQSPAQEFFGKTGRDAVMVVPFNEDGYFTGKYPTVLGHTCKTRGEVDGDNNHLTIRQLAARLIRDRRCDDGSIIVRCDACRHNYTWRLCQQIEQEVLDYQAWNVPLRFVIVDDLEKTIATSRKRYQRKIDLYVTGAIEEMEIKAKDVKKGDMEKIRKSMREKHPEEVTRYCAIPQSNGGGAIIHDQPDNLGGEMLPNGRTDLMALLDSWVDDQPDGSRIHVSEGWGREFQGNKPKGKGKKRKEGEEQENDSPVRLITKSYPSAKMTVEGLSGKKITRKNQTVNVSIYDFITVSTETKKSFAITRGKESVSENCPDLGLSYLLQIDLSRDKCITETPDSEIDQMLPLFPKAEMKGL